MNIYPIWARISTSASARLSSIFEQVFFPSCYAADFFLPREEGDFGFAPPASDDVISH